MSVKSTLKEFVCVALFVSFCLVGVSHGAIIEFGVKLEVDSSERSLAVSDTATIEVWGWAYATSAPNGLVGWELGLDVNADGIVGIKIDGGAPVVDFMRLSSLGNEWKVKDEWNDPWSGEISLAYTALGVGTSDAAVGGYMKLAEVTIEALAPGTVEYSVGDSSTNNFWGVIPGGGDNLAGDQEYGDWDGSIVVIPEPVSIALLLFGGVIAANRRRRR